MVFLIFPVSVTVKEATARVAGEKERKRVKGDRHNPRFAANTHL